MRKVRQMGPKDDRQLGDWAQCVVDTRNATEKVRGGKAEIVKA